MVCHESDDTFSSFLYGLICNACSQDHRIRWKDVSVYQNDGVEARRITLNHWTSQKLTVSSCISTLQEYRHANN